MTRPPYFTRAAANAMRINVQVLFPSATLFVPVHHHGTEPIGEEPELPTCRNRESHLRCAAIAGYDGARGIGRSARRQEDGDSGDVLRLPDPPARIGCANPVA